MSEKEPTSVNLKVAHKKWMDSENINRSQLINELITQYRTGKRDMDKTLKQFRLNQLEREMRSKESEMELLREEKSELENSLTQAEEEKNELMQDVKEKLESVPLNPDNPGVQAQAKRVEMEPEELIKEVENDVDR